MKFLKLLKTSLGFKENLDVTTTVIEGHKTEVTRVDANVPLNMRVGGLLDYPSSSLIVVQALGSVMTIGDSRQIVALSSIRANGYTLYRAYLNNTPGAWEFLQITVDTKGVVLESVLYSTFFEDTPQSDEEWSNYLDGGIGQITYTNEQGTEYNRVTGGSDDYVKPINVTETLVLTADGNEGDRSENSYHLYERALGASSEYVLTEVVDGSFNAYVRFMYGLPLSLTDIKFIPTNS